MEFETIEISDDGSFVVTVCGRSAAGQNFCWDTYVPIANELWAKVTDADRVKWGLPL